MFFKTFVKVAHKGCLYELIHLRIGDKYMPLQTLILKIKMFN